MWSFGRFAQPTNLRAITRDFKNNSINTSCFASFVSHALSAQPRHGRSPAFSLDGWLVMLNSCIRYFQSPLKDMTKHRNWIALVCQHFLHHIRLTKTTKGFQLNSGKIKLLNFVSATSPLFATSRTCTPSVPSLFMLSVMIAAAACRVSFTPSSLYVYIEEGMVVMSNLLLRWFHSQQNITFFMSSWL